MMWDHSSRCILLVLNISIGLVLASAGRQGWGFGGRRRTTTRPANPSFETVETVSLVSSSNNSTRATANTTPAWKRALPESLVGRKTLQRVLIPTSSFAHIELYLLGTSHVSNDSCADVRLLLQHVQPDVVFLELCSQRINLLEENNIPPAIQEKNASFWTRVDMVRQHGNMSSKWSAVGTVLLTQVQDDYAESLGVELGGEFRAAYQWCRLPFKKPNLILGDRPLAITLHRAWESLSWWGKLKVLGGLVFASLKKPNPDEIREWMQSILEGDSDVLTESMADMRKHFPSMERVIIKERDAYMACKLYQTCRMLPQAKNHTIVAIVGAGHLPGICSWLTDGNGQSPEQVLMELVETKKYKQQDVSSLVTDVTELPL